MANPQLSVEITARIDGLRDSFNKAVNETKGFDTKTKQALSSIDKSFASLANDIDKDMKRASTSVSSASNKISKDLAAAAVATSKSKNTYMDLGRVLQDLPYGFNGIQNNLTQIIPAAGLAGLAFTALVSAITFAQVGTDYWTRGLKENKKAIDSVKLAGQEYLDTLTQLNQARIKGEQDSTKELAQLKVLYGAYTDANLPLSVRQKAYKDIQEQYPAYFKNIKFEQDASKLTADKYNELTQAILATGRARAAVDLIAKNETRKLENEQKGIDLEKERIKLIAQRDVLQIRAAETLKTSTREGAGLADINRADNIQAKINENLKTQNNLKTDSNLLDANNLQLIKSVNTELVKGAEIIGSVGALGKVEKIAEAVRSLAKINNGGIRPPQYGSPEAQFKAPIVGNAIAEDAYKKLAKNALEAYNASLKLDESLNSILNGGVINGLSSAFTALGTSIASGGNVMESVGQSLLSSLGGVMVQLGELAIATGLGIKSIQLALRSLNPAVAIAAGVSLIALGSYFKAKSSQIGGGSPTGNGKQRNSIPGFANGVTNFGGGIAMVGERGRELVQLPTGSNVIPNSRTENIMRNNSGNITLNGNLAVNLETLYFALERTGKKLDRLT